MRKDANPVNLGLNQATTGELGRYNQVESLEKEVAYHKDLNDELRKELLQLYRQLHQAQCGSTDRY
jgi:hypothetical protein